MPTSQDVFALRKSGSLDEAYAMALEIMNVEPNEEWNKKAFAWCLYDLTKRAVSQNDYQLARTYIEQLDALQMDEHDEILINAVEGVKFFAIPERRIILQANEASLQGNHQQALILFRQAIQQFPNDIKLNTQFAWELHKEGKRIFDTERVDVQNARQLLAEYMKLKNPRPSLLHSLFLRFADRIKDKEEFNFIAFLKLWGLNNITEDDYEPYIKDGISYPGIAEKVIQHGAKFVLDKRLSHEVEFILPFLDVSIERFQDNIWLPYYKAKLLHLVHRNEDAIDFLIPVIKEKISVYWVWSLLAELVIETDKEKAISCYCKALLSGGEDKYVANVRVKLAELLIQKELWSEAKFEIASAIAVKEAEGMNVSSLLRNHQQENWYKSASDKNDNKEYYNINKKPAEEFIFSSLPWLDSCLGSTFTLPDKPNKPRRKIFISIFNEIIEVVISDKKFDTLRNCLEGDSIRIKGEYDRENTFQIYLLEKRNSQTNWDIFEWHIGNIIQALKNDAGEITAWRISTVIGEQRKEGVFEVQQIKEKFQIKEGHPVFVKLYQKEANRSLNWFSFNKESRVHILSIKDRRDGELWDSFKEEIGIVDHINHEKGVAHFIINKQLDSIVSLKRFKEKVEIGTKVSVRLKKVTKDRASYYVVLTCRITDEAPKEKLLRLFSGSVETSGKFGFADEVYIDRSLMLENKVHSSYYVSGVAILNYNKKKRSWGWKAIKILSSVPYEESNAEWKDE